MISTGVVLGERYALGAPIGSGGMADVYEAVDQRTGESVAVKVVRGVDPSLRQRVEGEARALERLSHPALVALRDVGEHDGAPFLVLDLVRGRCLAEVLRDGPLGPERAVEVIAPIADGLAHAHELGIVHRDVKPANVLLSDDGSSHLADFGIARLADLTGITRTGQVIGTASYLSPEQLRGDPVGPPSDIFSLGLVLLESITGERAFEGSPTESAMARLVRAPVIPDDVPEHCRSLLIRMTAATPAARPTAAEVAAELTGTGAGSAAAGATSVMAVPTAAIATTAVHDVEPDPPTEVLDTPAPPAPSLPRVEVPASVRRWRAVLVAGAVILAVVLFGVVVGRSGSTSAPKATPSTTTPTTAPVTGSLPPQVSEALDRLDKSLP